MIKTSSNSSSNGAVMAQRGRATVMTALVEDEREFNNDSDNDDHDDQEQQWSVGLHNSSTNNVSSSSTTTTTMDNDIAEVSLSGGPPWGFVFEGGSEFACSLIIAYIQPESVAARSGLLRVGDQIVGVGKTETNDCHALTLELIRATPPGDDLTLLLRRSWKNLVVDVDSNFLHSIQEPTQQQQQDVVVDESALAASTLEPDVIGSCENQDPQQLSLLDDNQRSPSLTSLNSTGSSTSSLPNNLLASSVSTLQRNCPTRKSESSVMLSTLVRKLQDSLPRRNSERHHNHPNNNNSAANHQAMSPQPPQQQQQQQQVQPQPQQFDYNQQPQHLDYHHHQQQQQAPSQPPKVKKALVSSFSFSLGRAPRPSGLSPPSCNGAPVTSSSSSNNRSPPSQSSYPSENCVLLSPDGNSRLVSAQPQAASVYSTRPMPSSSHQSSNSSVDPGSYDLSMPTSLRYNSNNNNEPQSSYSSNLHLHQIHHHPQMPQQSYPHSRMSASVVNLPATVSKSSPYVGVGPSWHNQTANMSNSCNSSNTASFIVDSPLDCNDNFQPSSSSSGYVAPPPHRPHLLHQFASCDQLNGSSSLYVQPTQSSHQLYLSRGARGMPPESMKTSMINETIHSVRVEDEDELQAIPERDSASLKYIKVSRSHEKYPSWPGMGEATAVVNNTQRDSMSAANNNRSVSWVSPTQTASQFPPRPDVPSRPTTLPVESVEGNQRQAGNLSSSSYANYARCGPSATSSRRGYSETSPTNSGPSKSQTTIVRPQPPASNKPNFAAGAVMVGRPPARVLPQYGSNHQLYYSGSSSAPSPPQQHEVNLNYSSSSAHASRSSPSIGLLDIQRQTKPGWQQQQQQQQLQWSPSEQSPPSLPPRRYAIEEIRGYIAAATVSPPSMGLANFPETDERPLCHVERSSDESLDYADQLRFQSRSLIAATGGKPQEFQQQQQQQPSIEKRQAHKDVSHSNSQHPRQVALIAPLLSSTSSCNTENNNKQNEREKIAAEMCCNNNQSTVIDSPPTAKVTPRKVEPVDVVISTSGAGDESIVSVQLPPHGMERSGAPSGSAANISRFYRRLLVRANSDVASKSSRNSPPTTPGDNNHHHQLKDTLPNKISRPSVQPLVATSTDVANCAGNVSFFCDIDSLASSAAADSKPSAPPASPPVNHESPIAIDGVCTIEEDADSAFAELSPGASHSSNSSSSGSRRNTSQVSTGRSSVNNNNNPASSYSSSSTATVGPVSVITSKPQSVQISLFSRQRPLLDDEIRCDNAFRALLRELPSTTETETSSSILLMGSSAVGQYLFQIAAVNSTMNSPLPKAWSLSSSENGSDVLTDDDNNDAPSRDLDIKEMLVAARVALARKTTALKNELERIERELSVARTQRRILIDQQLATMLSDIDDEALDRLRSRLDELEMGALLAVRVASRAARLSPSSQYVGKTSAKNNSNSGREWRAAVEKLDDVRDVIDSLRQRITGALSSKMLLTAISDNDLSDIANFVNSFGQLLFEYHEVTELVLVAEQQSETFNNLQQKILSSLSSATIIVGSSPTSTGTCSLTTGSVTVVVD